MAHVRTFVLNPKNLGLNQDSFIYLDSIPFREGLAREISYFEKELKLDHKTCQCIPIFDRPINSWPSDDLCIKVNVILTF